MVLSSALRLIVLCLLIVVSGVWETPTATANERCLQLVRNGNVERLVNRCNHCRVGALVRSRPGTAPPVTRKYDVQPGTVFPVPFKGAGRTRIASDRPCAGTSGGVRDLLEEAQRPKPELQTQCVTLEQSDAGGVRLANACGECRAAAVERYTRSGASGGRDYMLIAANTKQTIPSRGFAQVGLLGDIPCPN